VASSSTDSVDATLSELAALRLRLAEGSQRSDVELIDETSELLELQRGEVARLKAQVRWLEGKPYRSKPEKVAPGQLAFGLIEMMKGGLGNDEELVSDDDTPDEDESPEVPPTIKKKRKRRGRDLPREIVPSRLSIDDAARLCACCDAPKAEVGFDTQERFFHQPAKVTIIEERFYKYACSRCKDGIDTCEPRLPPKPIPGSMASASMLAFLVTSKVLDGLPIERVAKQLRRFGVDLATSTLNDWFGYTSAFFVAIVDRLREELRGSQLISIDDTPLAALNRDHPKNIQRGRQWMYIGDKSNVIYCEYTEDWKGSHPKKVLEGLDCDIQGDGYAGISSLFALCSRGRTPSHRLQRPLPPKICKGTRAG
jgi:transposase